MCEPHRPTVSVVIPAMNEEKNLPYVFSRIPEEITEVVLVDGWSNDRTVEVARELLPSVIVVTQTRIGKGNALACAFSVCKGDIIVMIDADGSTDPAEIPRFVEALINGADYAKGSRFRAGGGSADITRLRRVGNWGLNALVNMIFGTRFTDLCYGYNAFQRPVLDYLDLPNIDLPELEDKKMYWGDGFEIETLANIRVAKAGLTIVEVPSFESKRHFGRSNLNAVSDGMRVLTTIIKEYRRTRISQRRLQAQESTGKTTSLLSDIRQRLGPAHTAPAGTISIVIPAYTERRLPQLRATVASALSQQYTPAEVVVVIDHNETLFERASRELTGVTVVTNAFERGVSGNRNTGVLHTTTPLVAFLDDDIQAQPSWLEHLIAPFANENVIGTGGGIKPLWKHGKPIWFPDEFLWAVGGSYTGMPTTTAPIRNVWSANMCVRREIFESVGGFRVGFGKLGSRSRPEDTDLCLRMSIASGGQWIFVPEALVDHPAEHTTFWAFLRRCYQEGQGKVELARLNGPGRSLSSERYYLRRTLPQAVAQGVVDTVRGRGMAHLMRSGAVLAGVTAAAMGGLVEGIQGNPEPYAPIDSVPASVRESRR